MFEAWVTTNVSQRISGLLVHLPVPVTFNLSQLESECRSGFGFDLLWIVLHNSTEMNFFARPVLSLAAFSFVVMLQLSAPGHAAEAATLAGPD